MWINNSQNIFKLATFLLKTLNIQIIDISSMKFNYCKKQFKTSDQIEFFGIGPHLQWNFQMFNLNLEVWEIELLDVEK